MVAVGRRQKDCQGLAILARRATTCNSVIDADVMTT